MGMHDHFLPCQKNTPIRRTSVLVSDIGEHVRPLKSDDIKELFRQGVLQIVEYNTTGSLLWISHSECFEYWKWAQSHLFDDSKPHTEDYPGNFYLVPEEWITPSGERLILFTRFH
ncbi:hypothetical protein ABID20_002401 [Rhizobium alvei]